MLFSRLLLVSIFLSSLTIVGCKNNGKLDEIGAPNWVFDPTSVAKDSKEISAVGIGEPSKGGLKLQLAQAKANARGEIANKVLSEVSRISKDAIRKTTVSGVEDVEKIFSQATQEVVRDLPLSGTEQTHIWQDPATDTLYVRMAIEGKNVADYLKDSMYLYEKRLKQSGLGAYANEKNKELVEDFTKEVSDRFAKSPISNSSDNVKTVN